MEDGSKKEGLGPWDYVLGCSSLIPLFGLLTGLISIIVGLVKLKRGGGRLVLLGLAGFLVTGGTFFYYYVRIRDAMGSTTGVYGDAKKKAVQGHLSTIVQALEFHKGSNGGYPASLEELKRNNRNLVTFDMAAMGRANYFKFKPKDLRYLQYVVLPGERAYYLFSRGFDGEGFTEDDLFPDMNPEDLQRTGYRERPLDLSQFQASPVPERAPPVQAPAQDPPGGVAWRDPESGLRESKSTGKPILYDFTAEWCPPCRSLSAEVFDNPENAKRVNAVVVPVKVMDRRREDGSNSPVVDGLQSKYGINAFPTLILQAPGGSDYRTLRGYHGVQGTLDFLERTAAEWKK